MKTFRNHLNQELKDPKFKEAFEKEKRHLNLAVELAKAREAQKLSQKQLAKKAKITQQQLSKIENGTNCNTATLNKVCDALGLRLTVAPM